MKSTLISEWSVLKKLKIMWTNEKIIIWKFYAELEIFHGEFKYLYMIFDSH